MTVEDFNNLELASFDTVDVTMNDNFTRREFLYQGHAYIGAPERTNYLTGEIIPAQRPQMLYLGTSTNGIEGLPLEDIQSVTFVSRVNGL